MSDRGSTTLPTPGTKSTPHATPGDNNQYSTSEYVYTADVLADFWDAVDHEVNSIAAADSKTTWFLKSKDSAGNHETSSDIGTGSSTVENYFNGEWYGDAYYADAAGVYTKAKNGILGKTRDLATVADHGVEADDTGPFDFTGADDMMEGEILDPSMLLDKFGPDGTLTAEEYAAQLYAEILSRKAVADNRYNNDMPPVGSVEAREGKFGEAAGDAGREAIRRADKCALATHTGDTSGIKKYCAPTKKEAKKAAAEKTTRSLGFREQCFILSKVQPLAALKWEGNVGLPDTKDNPTVGKRWPYIPSRLSEVGTNACIMIHSDPFSFINKLAIANGTEDLLKLPSSEIAKLQPLIRFYKITKTSAGKEIVTPIHFETDASELKSVFKDSKQRNIGVGLQDFQVKFQGTNPFAAKKDLTAKVTIFATSFADLLRPRGEAGARYRYVDLALKTANAKPRDMHAKDGGVTVDDMSSLDFSIRAVVGTSPLTHRGASPALKKNFVTLEMTPTIHEFDFAEDGSVKFTINYKPFINENFNGQAYDIFSDPENTRFLLANQIIVSAILAECEVSQAAQFKRTQIERIKKLRADSLSYIIQEARKQHAMRYLYLPNNLLKQINREGPLFDFAALKQAKIKVMAQKGKDLATAVKDAAKKEGRSKSSSSVDASVLSTNQNEIPFIYLSDLIDVVLSLIDRRLSPAGFDADVNAIKASTMAPSGFNWKDQDAQIAKIRGQYLGEYENFKKLRIILGPIELVNPIDPEDIKIVSLGDIPISLKYFLEFMTSETIQKSIFTFPLDQFVNKLINKMLSSFLNDDTCFNSSVKQRTFLRRTTFIGYQPGSANAQYQTGVKYDPITLAHHEAFTTADDDPADIPARVFLDGASRVPVPLLDVVGPSYEASRTAMARYDQNIYSVFYTAKIPPIETYEGIRADDEARGVHHYAVGRDSGIIQEVKLVRDKRKGIAEARFAQDGFNGLKQLREMYHVEIKTYANLAVYPGMKIYVDPTGWVPSAETNKEIMEALGPGTSLTDFGIGGYYDVIDVEHFFGPGKFETQFRAMWTASAGNLISPVAPEPKPSVATLAAAVTQAAKCKVYAAGAPGAADTRADAAGTSAPSSIPAARADALSARTADHIARARASDAYWDAQRNPSSAPLGESYVGRDVGLE
jgi:hypothetical protein